MNNKGLGLLCRCGQIALLSPLKLRLNPALRSFEKSKVNTSTAESREFSPGTPVSSHREVDRVG